MNLQHYYWFFKNAIPGHICDDIIRYALQKPKSLASIGTYENYKTLTPKQLKGLKQKRDCKISWISENWLYKEIHPFVHAANKNANWNFNWDLTETCQFTIYQKDQYYDWHSDNTGRVYSDSESPCHGKIRKLSTTLSLSDEKEYKGGELEFDFRNMDPDKKAHTKICTEARGKGSLIVFPSFVWHRVRPITQGIRYSLVNWHLGAPFK